MTRRIASHKGGRTARAPEARIRPQTLAAIREVMQQRGKSFADLLEETYSGGTTMSAISIKTAKDIDATNAYYVTTEGKTVTAHTNPNGKGLWIDGKQVLGLSQFDAGKYPAAAIRRYFQKRS